MSEQEFQVGDFVRHRVSGEVGIVVAFDANNRFPYRISTSMDVWHHAVACELERITEQVMRLAQDKRNV